MIALPVRTKGVKAGVGTAKGKIQTSLCARGGDFCTPRVVSGCELNTASRVRTTIKAEGDRRSRAGRSGRLGRGSDRSEGIAKRIGSGNPVSAGAYVDI